MQQKLRARRERKLLKHFDSGFYEAVLNLGVPDVAMNVYARIVVYQNEGSGMRVSSLLSKQNRSQKSNRNEREQIQRLARHVSYFRSDFLSPTIVNQLNR